MRKLISLIIICSSNVALADFCKEMLCNHVLTEVAEYTPDQMNIVPRGTPNSCSDLKDIFINVKREGDTYVGYAYTVNNVYKIDLDFDELSGSDYTNQRFFGHPANQHWAKLPMINGKDIFIKYHFDPDGQVHIDQTEDTPPPETKGIAVGKLVTDTDRYGEKLREQLTKVIETVHDVYDTKMRKKPYEERLRDKAPKEKAAFKVCREIPQLLADINDQEAKLPQEEDQNATTAGKQQP